MSKRNKNNSIYGALPAAGHTLNRPSIPAHIERLIRRRAYELYERRGRVDGHAEEDWRRAEAEVLGTVFRRASTG